MTNAWGGAALARGEDESALPLRDALQACLQVGLGVADVASGGLGARRAES